MRALLALAGILCLGLGTLGAFLPLLPTVPFYLLAAFCFARSSERLNAWITNHATIGPAIANWRNRRAIGRRAKILASVSMLVSVVVPAGLGVATWILAVQAVVLAAVALFLWTRNEA